MYLNQFTCAGNLTADPELRYTKSGRPWVSCGIALNKPIPPRDDGGEWRSQVTFVDWTTWGERAKRCANRLKKGDTVLLAGKLKMEEWEDKQTGQKRRKLRLHVFNIQRCPKGTKNPSPQPSPQRGEGEEPEDPGAPGDDLPF